MSRTILLLKCVALMCVTDVTVGVAPLPPAKLAPYPPMHWHSWNTFCAEDMVNESNMREMADALLATGMVDAGYDTVNVVCNGWTGRDPETHMFTQNKELWPDGIESLAKYLHSKGMKLGCYTSPATRNCCGEPGSLGYEYIDMEFFAQVGCDHVMVDWCRAYTNPADTKTEYELIGKAIANSSNPNMIYGIWPGGMGKSWKWAADAGGHYWRTAADIMNSWDNTGGGGSVLHNFDVAYSIPDIASQTGPGRFTFLDQMVVGVAPNGTGDAPGSKGGVPGPGLNFFETQAHMSMWVMAASPLLTCNDVRNMSSKIKEILTNDEVLAVHKDAAARMAVRIDVGGGDNELHSAHLSTSSWSIYGKLLSDNSSAVMVLNRDSINTSVVLHMEDVGDSMHTSYIVRDLWAHSYVNESGMNQSPATPPLSSALSVSQQLTLEVPAHGVRMLRLYPVSPPPPPSCPEGYKVHSPGYWQNTDPCPQSNFSNCTEDHANGTISLCGTKCSHTNNCIAFEVFDAGKDDSACYMFLNELSPPFTSNLGAFTCVKGSSHAQYFEVRLPNEEALGIPTLVYSTLNNQWIGLYYLRCNG